MNQVVLNFNGGEINPYLAHRTDFSKHGSSAARMENVIPLPYGPITRRPGTTLLKTFASPIPPNSRAFPFISTDGENYIILVVPGTILIIRTTDGFVLAIFDFLSSNADTRRTQFAQINDVAIITHPESYPLRLTSFSESNWSLEFIEFKNAPIYEQNLITTRQISLLSNPIAPDWITATAYILDDVVLDAEAEWSCIEAHTADTTNRPSSIVGAEQFWRRKIYQPGDAVTLTISGGTPPASWSDGDPTAYEVGAVRRILPAYYENLLNPPPINPGSITSNPVYAWACVANHSTLPGTTDPKYPEFLTVWQPITFIQGTNAMKRKFEVGHHIVRNDRLFRCILAYTQNSSGAQRPPTGSSWETYWIEVTGAFVLSDLTTDWDYPTYPASEFVENNDTNYQSRGLHLRIPSSEPGAGSNWQKSWSLSATDVFRPAHAAESGISPGTNWQIAPSRAANDFQVRMLPIKTNNNLPSQTIFISGPWVFNTFGIWHGTFFIQQSRDNGTTWQTIRSYDSEGDRNIADEGEEDIPSLLRLFFVEKADTANTSTKARAILAPEKSFITSNILIDTYVDTSSVTGTALGATLSGKTDRWAEGAFSAYRGFPNSIAFHESRLVFAGTQSQSTTLWLSKTDSYFDFLNGPADTDAIQLTLTTPAQNRIQWLASQRRLFVGTPTAEWSIGSESADGSITPTDALARQYTNFGGDHTQPSPLADSFVFLSRNGQRLREIAYVDERAAYSAPELTRLADHLSSSGIRSIAWQQSREPSLWCTTNDGLLLHFAFNREDLIAAWSRHTTALGKFIHIITFPSNESGDDLNYVLINRDLNDGTIATLELLAQNWSDVINQPTPPEYPHALDSQLTFLEQENLELPAPYREIPLTLIIDDDTITTVTTGTDGIIELPEGTTCAKIGFPIHVNLTSLPIDLSDGGPGGTHSTRRRMHEVSLNVRHTAGGSITYDGITEPLDLPAPFTGWHDQTVSPAHADTLTFTISHSTPHPFTLLALSLRWRPTEKPL